MNSRLHLPLAFALGTAVAVLTSCGRLSPTPPPNPNASPALKASVPIHMIQYGCPTCHVIPGVPGAVGKVGPDLDQLAQRSYIAGTVPNTPGNLQQWIMHPQHFRPGTAMPEMNVSAQDAAEFAAWLEPAR